MEVGLGLGDFVLDGVPALPVKRSQLPPTQFSAHVYCGQMAGWVKTPLGMEIDLGPGHIVLDGDPAPLQKGHITSPPLFSAHVYCGQSPILATTELLSVCISRFLPWFGTSSCSKSAPFGIIIAHVLQAIWISCHSANTAKALKLRHRLRKQLWQHFVFCCFMPLCSVLATAPEDCLLSTVYTFSSTALPENLNSAQLSCVHGLVSISCNRTLSVSAVFSFNCAHF